MNARTGSLPHDLAGSLSPEQYKAWLAAREQQRKADERNKEAKA